MFKEVCTLFSSEFFSATNLLGNNWVCHPTLISLIVSSKKKGGKCCRNGRTCHRGNKNPLLVALEKTTSYLASFHTPEMKIRVINRNSCSLVTSMVCNILTPFHLKFICPIMGEGSSKHKLVYFFVKLFVRVGSGRKESGAFWLSKERTSFF